jgi:hypothetical protein
MIIIYTLTAHDDGYRVRNWFRDGQQTLDAAEDADTVEDAEHILRSAYLGPDVDGVEVRWTVSQTAERINFSQIHFS